MNRTALSNALAVYQRQVDHFARRVAETEDTPEQDYYVAMSACATAARNTAARCLDRIAADAPAKKEAA